MLLIGLTSYVPLFAQGVLGHGALVAGFALAAMTIGWPIAASLAGRLYLRFGFRTTVPDRLGSSSIARRARCCSPSTRTAPSGSSPLPASSSGVGLGLRRQPRRSIAAQSSVGWEQRGVVTGANLFARSVGSAVGVAVFGAIANAGSPHAAGGADATSSTCPPGCSRPRSTRVFVASAVVAVVMVLTVLIIPRRSEV